MLKLGVALRDPDGFSRVFRAGVSRERSVLIGSLSGVSNNVKTIRFGHKETEGFWVSFGTRNSGESSLSPLLSVCSVKKKESN